jgi:hypothetical protein
MENLNVPEGRVPNQNLENLVYNCRNIQHTVTAAAKHLGQHGIGRMAKLSRRAERSFLALSRHLFFLIFFLFFGCHFWI